MFLILTYSTKQSKFLHLNLLPTSDIKINIVIKNYFFCTYQLYYPM